MDAARPLPAYGQPPPAYLLPALPHWLPPPAQARRYRAETDDKEKDASVWSPVNVQSAFLGPSLWDTPSDQQLKYTDLEEFLNDADATCQRRTDRQQGLRAPGGPPPPAPQQQQQQQQPACSRGDHSCPASCSHSDHGSPGRHGGQELRNDEEAAGVKVKVKFDVSPSDLALATEPGTQFDPQTHHFSEEQLKPHAICKKSKKQVVPEDRKDQRYWVRRQRNNNAAKRSRDARRLKDNQIALRANFLEKENAALRQMMEELNRANQELKTCVNSCQCR